MVKFSDFAGLAVAPTAWGAVPTPNSSFGPVGYGNDHNFQRDHAKFLHDPDDAPGSIGVISRNIANALVEICMLAVEVI